jgi:hypothetical protein
MSVDDRMRDAAWELNASVEHLEVVGRLRHFPEHRRRQARRQVAAALVAPLLLAAALGIRLQVDRRASQPPASRPTVTTLPSSISVGVNVVRDGGFEAGRSQVHEHPGTTCRRVRGGATGRWALRCSATSGGSGPPGFWLDFVHGPTVRSVWTASVMVRGRPGVVVGLKLEERTPTYVGSGLGLVSSSGLKDTLWKQVATHHTASVPGSVLRVDVALSHLAIGQAVTIDNLQLTRSR